MEIHAGCLHIFILGIKIVVLSFLRSLNLTCNLSGWASFTMLTLVKELSQIKDKSSHSCFQECAWEESIDISNLAYGSRVGEHVNL